MPYRVEETENDNFVVIYYFEWDIEATAQVFWSANRSRAEGEAHRLNEYEKEVDTRMQKAFTDLLKNHKQNADEVLNMMEPWVTEKQIYLREGTQLGILK
jgi:hypothetical protein